MHVMPRSRDHLRPCTSVLRHSTSSPQPSSSNGSVRSLDGNDTGSSLVQVVSQRRHGTECVECAYTSTDTLIRDSKQAEASVIQVRPGTWRAFIRALAQDALR
ncbi:DUF397 domain-containing protein [Streptomyces sp. NPDC051133]|uniref:DUF397 domain-containing protein n=1 Tax=Streptomyces sp. NPDC051133 TaxID=3155521 RepID=UPI0034189BA0